MSAAGENIHATGIVLDGHGVLLRGPSGAGKSLLALLLLDEWEARGRPALLVSDDRVLVAAAGDTATMQAPDSIAGMIELRGRGIVRRPFAPAAPLRLVVDLVDGLERMVEEDELATSIAGVTVARCPVPRAGKIETLHQIALIREALRALPVLPRGHKKTA